MSAPDWKHIEEGTSFSFRIMHPLLDWPDGPHSLRKQGLHKRHLADTFHEISNVPVVTTRDAAAFAELCTEHQPVVTKTICDRWGFDVEVTTRHQQLIAYTASDIRLLRSFGPFEPEQASALASVLRIGDEDQQPAVDRSATPFFSGCPLHAHGRCGHN